MERHAIDENEPSFEGLPPTRGEVIEHLKTFADRGYTSPFDLPKDDTDVQVAFKMLDDWNQRAVKVAQHSPLRGSLLAHQVIRDTVFYEAGFQDPAFLMEVVSWLKSDELEAMGRNLPETVSLIRQKRIEITNKIRESLGLELKQ